jgi:hypothetical protein
MDMFVFSFLSFFLSYNNTIDIYYYKLGDRNDVFGWENKKIQKYQKSFPTVKTRYILIGSNK